MNVERLQPAQVDREELELAVGGFEEAGERFDLKPLLEDQFVLAMRRDHPVGRSPVTLEAIATLRHLEISSSGEDATFIDEWLAQQRLRRRIAHRAPYLSMVRLLSQSDMVVMLSRRVAEPFVRTGELQIWELPSRSPRVTTAMLWHRRLENQPAHRWLRGLVENVCQRL